MNAKRTLVSVIVPTRNSGRTIEACLKSIRDQLYRPIELIVIDNNSTDHTLDIALRYGDLVESYGSERSAQRNRGALLSSGDYLLFVDSDMTLAHEIVADCLDIHRRTGAPAVIIPELSFGEGFLAKCRALERSCYAGDDSVEAARFFPRHVFEESGGFDEGLFAFEDWDLSMRIAEGNHLPRSRGQISHDEGRLHLLSVLGKKRRYAASYPRFRQKHGGATISQANPVLRGAFARNWRRLLRHPLLTVGFISLKSMEAGAGVVGLLEAWSSRRRSIAS